MAEAFEVLGIMTDEGRKRQNEMYATGKSFKVTHFTVTSKGHDPDDTKVPLAPDPLIAGDEASDVGGLVDLTAISGQGYAEGTQCPWFTCLLQKGFGTGEVSQIILFAEIVYSPTVDDPELNTKFAFAVANHGMKTKTALDEFSVKFGLY